MSSKATKRIQQMELFPTLPPRPVSLASAPVLFPALTPASYEPAGFLVHLPRRERAE
jgi:hypothetical protein